MLKSLKLCKDVFIAAMLTFAFSFSALQACVMLPGKPCSSEPCTDEACPLKEAKALLIKVSTTESVKTEEVVLNINGMHCGGCASKVKAALTACEGVTEVQVSFEDSKAVVHIEDGEADKHVLIEAVKRLGYKVTEG
ncbi:MAG: heavy-metal-associated domain-containing protein [Candidatus Brocadiales bacterium]|nr:heavy-metal-associated domain-containing protein [Candidatus Brocadiales bacterium]